MRSDLNMRKGKAIAQGSHASMAFLTKNYPRLLSQVQRDWLDNSFTKICLKVESEQELLDIEREAILKNVECHVVTDNGKTEFNGIPTKTCLALGPDHAPILDEITGHLKLW